MKDNDINNEMLESQIGDMGGIPDQFTEESVESTDHADTPANFGKLRHIPGQQDELTQEEEDSRSVFEHTVMRTRENVQSMDIRDGWIPIDRGDMGIRSQFYPESWQFRVRPADVKAIKNWSSINEENLAVVNNVMNEIVKSCISIFDTETQMAVSWDKLNSWDRFWFVLKVREYTFVNGEQAMEFDEECDNCGSNIHFILRSENLFYEFPDAEVVDRHWNAGTRYWDIDPKDYDVDYKKVKLFVPTLGKDTAILQWLYAQNEAGKSIDETFVKFLPYLLERAPKDSSLLDRMIKDCQSEFKRWDTETFLFFDEVRRNITINPSEKLSMKCPNCGEEVRSTVRFPNGIKYLFAVQGKHRKFGSK
jgi:hypothetical protein